MRRVLLCLAVLLLLGGCQAGTSAQLLGYDAIQAAAVEAQKGASAQHQAVLAAQSQDEKALIDSLVGGIETALKSDKMAPDEAAVVAGRVKDKLLKDLANLKENNRRATTEYQTLADNLAYIETVAGQSKEFVIFKSDIDTQWKAYIQAQARAQLEKRRQP